MAPRKHITKPLTEEEIVAELKLSACAKLEKKRELVLSLVKNQEAVVAEMRRIDSIDADRMQKTIPSEEDFRKTTNKNATFVAIVIYHVTAIFSSFVATRKSMPTRSASNNKMVEKTMELLPPIKAVRDRAVTLAKNKKSKECNKMYLDLDPVAMNRKFLEGGGMVPEQEGLHRCYACNYCFVDEPRAQNQAAALRNQKRLLEHSERKKEHEKMVKEGTATGRAPKTPKMEPVYVQCHCHQMRCIRGGGGTCPTCNENPPKYNNKGQCDCPVCSCNCSVAYQVCCCVYCCVCCCVCCVCCVCCRCRRCCCRHLTSRNFLVTLFHRRISTTRPMGSKSTRLPRKTLLSMSGPRPRRPRRQHTVPLPICWLLWPVSRTRPSLMLPTEMLARLPTMPDAWLLPSLWSSISPATQP